MPGFRYSIGLDFAEHWAWSNAHRKFREAQRELENAQRKLENAQHELESAEQQLMTTSDYCSCEMRYYRNNTYVQPPMFKGLIKHDPDCERRRPPTMAKPRGDEAARHAEKQRRREEQDRLMAEWNRRQILVNSEGMHYRRGLAAVDGTNPLRPVINPRTEKQDQDWLVTGDPIGPRGWAGMPPRPKFPFPEAPGPYEGTDGQVLYERNPASDF